MKYSVINNRDILKVNRFDGSYHNAEINIYDAIIKSHSNHNLDYYCTSIFTSGRAKRIYTKKEFGFPFLSNADVSSHNPLSSCKYVSKKYSYDKTALLKGGMILTGRVGAIGQTSFVPNYWEKYNMMGSDNIIRIVVKPEFKNGFLYAYLASKIGNLSFWKHATGGVQPFITDKMVGNLPIPNFSSSFETKIDDLIQYSSHRREQAYSLLDETHNLITSHYSHPSYSNIQQNIVSQKIYGSQFHRFDSSFYLSDANYYESQIKEGSFKLLGDLCNDIFCDGRSKRYYAKNKTNAVPFFSNGDLVNANPLRSCKYAIKSRTFEDRGLLKEGMIVTGRVGAIGQTAYIGKNFENRQIIGSDNIIRIVPKEYGGFIYAFLSSFIGNKLFWKYSTGGVQPYISPKMIEEIPVPIYEISIMERIDALSKESVNILEEAISVEEQAISYIEEEIEKWQSSKAI